MRTIIVMGLLVLGACSDDETGGKSTPPPPPPTTVGLTVSSAAVRGCDLLLDGAEVTGVTFGDTVQGEFSRWSPRTAVSFVMRADAAPSGSLASVTFPSGATVTVARATCYDRL